MLYIREGYTELYENHANIYRGYAEVYAEYTQVYRSIHEYMQDIHEYTLVRVLVLTMPIRLSQTVLEICITLHIGLT